MFGKKFQCPKCGEKVDRSFSYCPHCGSQLRANEKREREPDNLFDALDDNFRMPFLLKFPFKKLVKEIEQQFREMDKTLSEEKGKTGKIRKSPLPIQRGFSQGISISIGGSPDGKPVIRVKQFGPGAGLSPKINEGKSREERKPEKESIKKLTKVEKAKLDQFAKLPKQEPETNVRRLSDRIIYEILIPGIKDKKNIIINRLQNSIEIKAFTKDKAYFKLIPLSLPIKRHYLEKEKLILELKPQI